MASEVERGRPLANAAVELPDKDHSARRVSRPLRPRSGTASFNFTVPPRWQSRKCADELFLLLEGARVT